MVVHQEFAIFCTSELQIKQWVNWRH